MITLSKRRNDCVICAYSSCTGLTWKQSKDKLKKHLASRKGLGVLSRKCVDLGVDNFSILSDGSFKTTAAMFKYKKGIVFISFGDGKGHGVYWNGFKFIDNSIGGRFNNIQELDDVLRENESICLVLQYEKTPLLTILSSFIFSIKEYFK